MYIFKLGSVELEKQCTCTAFSIWATNKYKQKFRWVETIWNQVKIEITEMHSSCDFYLDAVQTIIKLAASWLTRKLYDANLIYSLYFAQNDNNMVTICLCDTFVLMYSHMLLATIPK